MSDDNSKKGLVSNASNLEQFVGYQDGSVVSREVIKKKSGTVTVFAFDDGQGLSEHTAPFDAMIQILDGEAEVVIGGEKHLVAKGEAIIMPASIPHSLRAEKRFKMLLIMIKQQD